MNTDKKEPTPEWAKELAEEHCTRENVMKLCRYFRGETTPPYPETEDNAWLKSLFWGCEKMFVDYMIAPPADTEILELGNLYIDEAHKFGLFKEIDGVFPTLVAFLLNRYCHWNADDPHGYEDWLKRYYIGLANS